MIGTNLTKIDLTKTNFTHNRKVEEHDKKALISTSLQFTERHSFPRMDMSKSLDANPFKNLSGGLTKINSNKSPILAVKEVVES